MMRDTILLQPQSGNTEVRQRNMLFIGTARNDGPPFIEGEGEWKREDTGQGEGRRGEAVEGGRHRGSCGSVQTELLALSQRERERKRDGGDMRETAGNERTRERERVCVRMFVCLFACACVCPQREREREGRDIEREGERGGCKRTPLHVL